LIGKIIRARPKYLTEKLILNTINGNHLRNIKNSENELFFGSGRSALKFFLIVYKRYINKENLNILMQSFNCSVVMQASLEAGCYAKICDIKLDDFSIDYNYLNKIKKKPDILILTHYQGIPNLQYFEIADFCKKNSIFLIDDISQTEGSSINGIKIGSLSDVSLKSFGFDKPISCFKGGSLCIDKLVDKNLKNYILKEYKKIPTESRKSELIDLRTLHFLLSFTQKNYYNKKLNNYELLKLIIHYSKSNNMVYRIMKLDIFSKLYHLEKKIEGKIINKSNIININKLNSLKISLIKKQRDNYKYDYSIIDSLEQYLKKIGIKIDKHDNIDMHWNRYSLLDKNNELKKLFEKMNIEVGNYNWPKGLHDLYHNNSKVIINDRTNYNNTIIANKYILNIPIWENFYGKK